MTSHRPAVCILAVRASLGSVTLIVWPMFLFPAIPTQLVLCLALPLHVPWCVTIQAVDEQASYIKWPKEHGVS